MLVGMKTKVVSSYVK